MIVDLVDTMIQVFPWFVMWWVAYILLRVAFGEEEG